MGSTGAPEADRRRRLLKRETKKQARAAAKQASVDKFFRPPRLSIEFAFIVLLRDRCTEAVCPALGLSDVLISGCTGQHTDRLLEAYLHGDRALPAQLLRRTCGSGFLRHVVMRLTQFRNGPKNFEGQGFMIVKRAAAQHMCGARTPEVRLSFCAFYCVCCLKPIAVRFRAGPSSLGRRAVPRSHRLFRARN